MTMRDEYDFSHGERGRYYARYHAERAARRDAREFADAIRFEWHRRLVDLLRAVLNRDMDYSEENEAAFWEDVIASARHGWMLRLIALLRYAWYIKADALYAWEEMADDAPDDL